MILCDRFPTAGDDPQDPAYKFTRTSKDGRTGVFIPRTEGTGFDPIAFERRKREQEEERRRYLAGLMPEPTRDREIQEILARLTLTAEDRRRLNARGLPDDLIDSIGYRSLPNQWQPLGQGHDLTFGIGKGGNLKNHTPGILCPFQGASGAFVGAKVWNYDYQTNGQPKYYWLGRDGHKLPNGELPHAVYGADLATPGGVVALCEGLEIKPALAALALGIPVIGTNGSAFDSSPETLKQTLTTLGAQTVVFYPDAGAVINPNLPARYIGAADLIESFGLTVAFAWWGQTEKSAGDIDEISPETLASAVLISPAEFKALCPAQTRPRPQGFGAPTHPKTTAPFNFAAWLDRQVNRLTNRRKPAPRPAPEVVTNRLDAWLEPGDFDVLDRSFMGSGKSFTVPEVTPLEGGKVWYAAADHRNPSNIQITGKFTDLDPRSDHLWKIENGRKVKAPLDDPDGFKAGYCPSAGLFTDLADRGYSPNEGGADNPICSGCPFAGTCKTTAGWYRHDRRETLSHTHIRCSIESFPRDYDPARDILIVDEAGQQLAPTKQINSTFPSLLSATWQTREQLAPELWAEWDRILAALDPLFQTRELYGLTHDQILAALPSPPSPELSAAVADLSMDLGEIFQPADGLDLSKSERRELGKGALSAASEFFHAQAKAEAQERLAKLPPAILSPLLTALSNHPGAVARIHNGTLSLEIDRRPDLDFLGKFNRVIYLDATLDPADLARLTPRPIKVIQTAPPDLSNLTVIQIQTAGLGSNDLTPTAINRCQLVLNALPSSPVICPKSIKDALGAQGHWFKDSRDVNTFDGAETLAFVGLPRPNVGQIQDQYRCLTGSLEGWEDYYQRRQEAEIIQGVLGRQRAARYPDRQFTCYVLTGPKDDLSFLTQYGAVLQTRTAFEICPEAGNPTQITRWRLLEALRETGAATQGALAKALGCTQQAVSKALKSANVTLSQLLAELEKLTTAPIKGPYRAGCETSELLRQFGFLFDLPPADIVADILSAAKKGDPFDYVKLFPEAAQARILGILYGLLSYTAPDPPPL